MKSSRNIFAKILGYIFDYILCQIERFLEYLVKNAYIIVAKDGTPLITSGKRAIKLFKDHFEDLVALNQIGNVVLWLGKLFVVLICAFVGNALLPVIFLNYILRIKLYFSVISGIRGQILRHDHACSYLVCYLPWISYCLRHDTQHHIHLFL
jgi:Plasma-membrane choline transporter